MAGIETATYIEDLVPANPDGSADKVSGGDDHLRLIKQVLQNQFPDLGAEAVTATGAELSGAATAHVATTRTADRLYVRNGSPSDSTVHVTADAMLVSNANGGSVRLTSVDVTVSITGGTGINKLDTGTEAALTWYYVYVIYDGTTVAGLLSLASDMPTELPSGYTFWCRVGAVYNDSTPDFREFDQRGSLAMLEARHTVVSAGAATTPTLVDLSTTVPAVADTVLLLFRIEDSGSSTSKVMTYPRSTGGASGPVQARNPGGTTDPLKLTSEMPMATPQTIWYQVEAATNEVFISVTGWRF